ncbi:MAG: serine protease [Planctomycetales bacterium]|nr:serine protease [Planctomycetales bacterium]
MNLKLLHRTFCCSLFSLASCLSLSTCQLNAGESGSFAAIVKAVQPRIVKIYGAGGYAGLEAYQSGFLISADGAILTVRSTVLDTDDIQVTLDDGRKFAAKLVGIDPQMEIAVLKIEAEGLPHFELNAPQDRQAGLRVLAFSNLFRVAQGNEDASVQHGVVSAVTLLNARRGTFQSAYRGTVYVLDAITNNPGATGGAVTDRQGQLVGIIGKELRSRLTNTWLNYAIPVGELSGAAADILAGKTRVAARDERFRPEQPLVLEDLGLVLIPDVVERTPPYVDRIRPGSAADAAGVAADDLIVFVDGQLVASCQLLREAFDFIEPDATVQLTVLRGQELIEVELKANGQ